MSDLNARPFDFAHEADRLIAYAGMLETLELGRLISEVDRAHVLGPILDPTRYRDALRAGHIEDVATLARLALPLVAQYRKIAERELPATDGS